MSEAQFVEVIGREGLTLAAYRRRIRWQMERGAIVRVKRFKDVSVTEQEVREYFRENAERFLVGSQVREEAIFLPFPAADPGAAETRPRRRGSRRSRPSRRSARDGRSGGVRAGARDAPRGAVGRVRLRPGGGPAAGDPAGDPAAPHGETSQPFFTEAGIYIVRVVARRGGRPGTSPP